MTQHSLFLEELQKPSLSVSDVASTLSVSTATVRNWLKTGYLNAGQHGGIEPSSVSKFKNGIANSSKLTKRANKSKADSHDHEKLCADILTKLKDSSLSPSSLGGEYEAGLSASYRNNEGVFYTPREVCETFFENLQSDAKDLVFCDPCCGSGEFLVAAFNSGFSVKNLIAFDIDPIAVEIARRRIFEVSGEYPDHFHCVDFLSEDLSYIFLNTPADVIFTNPPWGKKLPKEIRAKLSNRLGSKGSDDTMALFLAASYRYLRQDGLLGLLLPEAYFNVSAYAHSRRELLKNNLLWLRDFGKAFEGLLTNAQAFAIKKSPAVVGNTVRCTVDGKLQERPQTSFATNPNYILNFRTTSEESHVIEYLFSLPHTTLEGQATWALGVVTGDNSKLISNEHRADHVPIYRGSDITRVGLKKPTSFVSTNMSSFQQVAPTHFYHAPEKLIYRFICNELIFYCDTDQSLIINSANLLITNNDFPIPMPMLANYFNSDLMTWLFRKLFATHKVLRSDLEKLPIFVNFLVNQTDFNELNLLNAVGILKDKNGSYRIKKANS